MTSLIMSKCAECENSVSAWDDDTRPLCEYCGCDTELQYSVKIHTAHLGGHAVATCSECDFTCVYWDCACDLVHECEADK